MKIFYIQTIYKRHVPTLTDVCFSQSRVLSPFNAHDARDDNLPDASALSNATKTSAFVKKSFLKHNRRNTVTLIFFSFLLLREGFDGCPRREKQSQNEKSRMRCVTAPREPVNRRMRIPDQAPINPDAKLPDDERHLQALIRLQTHIAYTHMR